MARPKKEMPPAYTHRVTVRLTDEMYAVLHKDAKAPGQGGCTLCHNQIMLNHLHKDHDLPDWCNKC